MDQSLTGATFPECAASIQGVPEPVKGFCYLGAVAVAAVSSPPIFRVPDIQRKLNADPLSTDKDSVGRHCGLHKIAAFPLYDGVCGGGL